MKYYIMECESKHAEIWDEDLQFVKDCESITEAVEWCGEDEYEIAYPAAK